MEFSLLTQQIPSHVNLVRPPCQQRGGVTIIRVGGARGGVGHAQRLRHCFADTAVA